MKITPWPNKLGYDVGPHEVWDDPLWKDYRVKTYRNGETYKHCIVPKTLNLVDAVKYCKQYGCPEFH